MSMPVHKDPRIRRAIRMLGMVHELHKQGYQKLRIAPGMIDSDEVWVCDVTHTGNIDRSHGALLSTFPEDDLVARYSSLKSNEYFGWLDARADNSRKLATKFIQRFSRILARGKGTDWEYVGWYVMMLGIAEAGNLPVAYAGKDMHDKPDRMATVSYKNNSVFIPSPPIVKYGSSIGD